MKKIMFQLGMVCILMLGMLFIGSTLSVHASAEAQIKINKKNFPDQKFRWYVIRKFDKNKNGSLSKKEIKAAKKIEISQRLYAGWEGTSVLNLQGMEYFTNMRELCIYDFRLKNFDLPKMKKLKRLSLGNTHLKVLDLRKNKKLTALWLYKNNVAKIKFASPCRLKRIDMMYEKKLQKPDFSSLKELELIGADNMPYKKWDLRKCKNLKDVSLRYWGGSQGKDNGALQKILFGKSNKKLKTIVLSGGRLESADWLCKFPNLEVLNLSCNNFTALDVTKNRKLKSLYCSGNHIKHLDISQLAGLNSLNCSENDLTALDVTKNSMLSFLDCSKNSLTDLDLSRNTALDYLDCSKNHLSSLELSRNGRLTELNCSKNPLKSLDISALTELKSLDCSNCQLTSLDTSSNKKLTKINSEGNPFK